MLDGCAERTRTSAESVSGARSGAGESEKRSVCEVEDDERCGSAASCRRSCCDDRETKVVAERDMVVGSKPAAARGMPDSKRVMRDAFVSSAF